MADAPRLLCPAFKALDKITLARTAQAYHPNNRPLFAASHGGRTAFELARLCAHLPQSTTRASLCPKARRNALKAAAVSQLWMLVRFLKGAIWTPERIMSSIAVETNATIKTKRLGCGSHAGHEPIIDQTRPSSCFCKAIWKANQSASDPNPRRLDDLMISRAIQVLNRRAASRFPQMSECCRLPQLTSWGRSQLPGQRLRHAPTDNIVLASSPQ